MVELSQTPAGYSRLLLQSHYSELIVKCNPVFRSINVLKLVVCRPNVNRETRLVFEAQFVFQGFTVSRMDQNNTIK